MRKIPSLSLSLSLYLDTGNTHPTSIKIQSKGLFSLSPFLLFYRWGVCTRLRPPPQQYKPYHIARPRMNRRDEKRPVKKRDRFFILFFFLYFGWRFNANVSDGKKRGAITSSLHSSEGPLSSLPFPRLNNWVRGNICHLIYQHQLCQINI